MSQADELLAKLAESPSDHFHPVVDDDDYFVIDPDTKRITNKSGRINYIMQKDHKSERYTIELPRIVEGHDMTLCNRVYVYFNNVGENAEIGREDFAEITDLQVSPDNPDTVICTWLIERHATQLVGSLAFLIQYACALDDGTVDYEFHSDWYSNIVVKKGRPDPNPVILEYNNILEQWYRRIFGTADGILTNIADAERTSLEHVTAAETTAIKSVNSTAADRKAEIKAESSVQQAAIEAKGQETLDSIPADYTETYRIAEEALRTKADAIALEAAGNSIVIDDASDDHLLGLKVFGKTEQAGTPSSENPQELVGVVNPEIRICGKNQLNIDHNGKSHFNTTSVVEGETITVITSKEDSVSRVQIPVDYPLNVPLTVSFDATMLQGASFMGDNVAVVYLRKGKISGNGSYIIPTTDKRSYSFTLPDGLAEEGYELWLYVKLESAYSGTVEIKFENIQVEVGTEATEYEPYKSVQTLATQRTLNAIGDVKDELIYDFQTDTWQLVQRVFGIVIESGHGMTYNTTDKVLYYSLNPYGVYGLPIYCTHFADMKFNGNGSSLKFNGFSSADEFKAFVDENEVRVLYPLAAPIIHELTAAEVLAFKALRTNKTNTVIQNGVGAHMEVVYAADTLKFLRDNQPKPTNEQVLEAVNEYAEENGIQVPSDEHIKEVAGPALTEAEVTALLELLNKEVS